MENVNYRQMAMVLLAASEAMLAALKHRGLECDDITLEYENDDGSKTSVTTTVDAIIGSCGYALGVGNRRYQVREQDV